MPSNALATGLQTSLRSSWAVIASMKTSLQHLFSPPSATLIQAAAATPILLLAAWLYHDYQAWLAFGTGGTPPNLPGYLKVTKFRILLAWSGDSLRDHSSLSPSAGPSHLTTPLPLRRGPPPSIIPRTLPQRQTPTNDLDAAARSYLHALPHKYAASHAEHVELAPSATEGRTTDAIYARDTARTAGARDRVLGHEIAHVHPAENSLHVWLTQPDAKKVVAAGWGERFPLSSLGLVDPGWTFVYAPRDMAEVEVVERIVRAGVAHLTGREV